MEQSTSISGEQFIRELLDRCIKAEVRVELISKREDVLWRAAKDAVRAKSPEKARAILETALEAWHALL